MFEKNRILMMMGVVISITGLALLFQNCSGINLAAVNHEAVSLSCDPSVYDISREANKDSGQTVYFVRENNREISKEYSGEIQWFVNNVLQSEEQVVENRLFLNCETHPETVEVRARLISDCGDFLNIVESFIEPPNCEEEPVVDAPPETPSPTDYCEEYKAKYPDIVGTPGFQPEGLEKVERPYESLFLSGVSLSAISFSELVRERNVGSTGWPIGKPIPGETMVGRYLAIPLTVPEDAPLGSWSVSFLEMQYNPDLSFIFSGEQIMTMSPCPGDFRQMPTQFIPSQSYGEMAGYQYGGRPVGFKHFEIVDEIPGDFPGGGRIYVPRGKTIYLNVTHHMDLNPNNSQDGYGCMDASPEALALMDNIIIPEAGYSQGHRIRQYGCGVRMEIAPSTVGEN